MERQSILSANTLIPIGALVIVIGCASWLTTIFLQGEANAAQIVEVKAEQEKSIDKVYQKLDKIAEKLDRLIEKNDK